MKTLICTVGLPRSGKSTWANEQGFPIICPDAIRLGMHGQRYLPQAEDLVWTFTFTMVRAIFLAGHNIAILDATSLTLWARNEIRRQLAMYEVFTDELADARFKVFDTPKEVCIERANNTFPDLVKVIERMSKHIDPLKETEYLYEG
jgi:predicted kinase